MVARTSDDKGPGTINGCDEFVSGGGGKVPLVSCDVGVVVVCSSSIAADRLSVVVVVDDDVGGRGEGGSPPPNRLPNG